MAVADTRKRTFQAKRGVIRKATIGQVTSTTLTATDEVDVRGNAVITGAIDLEETRINEDCDILGDLTVGGTISGSVDGLLVDSGTYTATVTAINDITAITDPNPTFFYMRGGSRAMIFGRIDFTASNGIDPALEITLPIATDFTTGDQAHGFLVGHKTVTTTKQLVTYSVESRTANNKIRLTGEWSANGSEVAFLVFAISYLIQ